MTVLPPLTRPAWRSVALAAALCAAPLAQAAAETALYSPGHIARVLGSLLLVLACLLGVLYLLRRLQGGQSDDKSALRIVSSLKVGTRERVLLLQAGEAQVLVGVAAGSVRTLHVFASAGPEGGPSGRTAGTQLPAAPL